MTKATASSTQQPANRPSESAPPPRQRESGRPTRRSRSRTRLLDAARQLLIDTGPRSVTVDAVSEMSGVAKSTLYRHFSSRDDLLLATVRESLPTPPEVEPELGFEANFRRALTTAARQLIDDDWGTMLLAVLMLRRTEPRMIELLDQDKAPKTALLMELLAMGEAEGIIEGPFDPELTVFSLFGPIAYASFAPGAVDATTLADHVADQFIAAHRPVGTSAPQV